MKREEKGVEREVGEKERGGWSENERKGEGEGEEEGG